MLRDEFIRAIHERLKVRLTFYSKEDRGVLVRTCAPMDIAPGRNIRDGIDRYWFWDYDSDEKRHSLPLLPDAIQEMVVLQATFDPAEFVTWTPDWVVARNWGPYS